MDKGLFTQLHLLWLSECCWLSLACGVEWSGSLWGPIPVAPFTRYVTLRRLDSLAFDHSSSLTTGTLSIIWITAADRTQFLHHFFLALHVQLPLGNFLFSTQGLRLIITIRLALISQKLDFVWLFVERFFLVKVHSDIVHFPTSRAWALRSKVTLFLGSWRRLAVQVILLHI